jgi:hypothetical protein
MLDLRKDGREDKIVKIQAHARGFLTRKHMNEEFQAQQMVQEQTDAGALNRPSFNDANPQYNNADVQAIRE